MHHILSHLNMWRSCGVRQFVMLSAIGIILISGGCGGSNSGKITPPTKTYALPDAKTELKTDMMSTGTSVKVGKAQ